MQENSTQAKEESDPRGAEERARDAIVDIKTGNITGNSGTIILAGGNVNRPLTPGEILKEELASLKAALNRKRDDLLKANTTLVTHKFDGSPLEIGEGNFLVGRSEAVESLFEAVQNHQTVILSGASGTGKSSIARAGLMARLLEQKYLPILVDVSNQSLPELIKEKIMSDVSATQQLEKLNLSSFLEHAAICLNSEETLLLILDGFENLYLPSTIIGAGSPAASPAAGIEIFEAQWNEGKQNSRVKWLFIMDTGVPSSATPFADCEELQIPLLDRLAASEAIHSIEQHGSLGEQSLREILDGLDTHGDAQDRLRINPSELEIVLRTLQPEKSDKSPEYWYEDANGLHGIFKKYVASVIKTKFPLEARAIVEEILALLEDQYHGDVAISWLQARIKGGVLKSDLLLALLLSLKRNRILALRDHTFRIASISMKRAVRSWLDDNSLVKRESERQLERIRSSALRGLIGGAVGFALFRWIVGTPVTDPAARIFYGLLYGAMGGAVGLSLTLFVDIFIARDKRRNTARRYLLSLAAGLVVFAVALAIFVYLGEAVPDDNPFLPIFQALIVGGVWGAAVGIAIAWAFGFVRIPIWSPLVGAFLGSAALYLSNRQLPVLNSSTDLKVFIGGLVFSLVIIAVVLYREYAVPAD